MESFLPADSRVLVVDDRTAARKAVAAQLRRIGYDVVAAVGAPEALEKVGALKVDLVVGGFAGQTTRGMVFFRELRKTADVPFIMLTEKAAAAARSAGARDLLFQIAEPAGTRILEDTSQRAIELHRMVSRMRAAVGSFRNVSPAQVEVSAVGATEARNEFASVLDRVMQLGVVIINKQDAPRAVLLSFEEFNSLLERPGRKLDTLSDEFDSMLARMQTPRARKAMKAAFDATPAALGAAAVSGARERKAQREKERKKVRG